MTQEAWVKSQTRTMTGWVNSKLSNKVEDLRTGLGDGLVLIELINAIVSDVNPSLGLLTPVYEKPKFALQKMENINDALRYCRLVLQVSTCNISAEDIVGGNLKLILGLVWTLFVFATASLLSMNRESKSFSEIKAILLHWLNERRKHHALDTILNFNIDWSLQKDKRPDLMFATIFDHYSPGLIDYRDFAQRKPLANLRHIISLAKSHFNIMDLAIAEDFNVLVPDEKSVSLYVLQWYIRFVVEPQELTRECDILELAQNHEQKAQDSFLSVILKAKKLKNQYDTKSLRLSNQINSNLTRFRRVNDAWENFGSSFDSAFVAKAHCEGLDTSVSSEKVFSGDKHEELIAELGHVAKSLSIYEIYKTEILPSMIREFTQLKRICERLNNELRSGGLNCKYEPLKLLRLEALISKYEELRAAENTLKTNITSIMAVFTEAKLDKFAEVLRSHKDSSHDPLHSVLDLKKIESLIDSISAVKDLLQQDPESIPAISIEEVDDATNTQQNADDRYLRFRDKVSRNSNRQNLTYTDLKKLIKQLMLPSELNSQELQDIIRLIPARTILSRTESETYSDDSSGSIDSCVLFEEALKSLEHKLSGNYNKIYDLNLFLGRLESGFSV